LIDPTNRLLANDIFNVTTETFVATAINVFEHQVLNNAVFGQYVQQVGVNADQVQSMTQIPPLPIEFFKTHQVTAYDNNSEPAIIFTSSGTSGLKASRHFVPHAEWYEQSFRHSFAFAYGDPSDVAWLCLLPSYLERTGSSLIYMADYFIKNSAHTESGFFLKADEALIAALEHCRIQGKKTILLGVTFALLDFAERHAGLDLSHVIIMETGGMKGRHKEMTRAEVHEQLASAFNVGQVHSEFGMTELMSQAYAKQNGIYVPPPWMRVMVRSEEDPFSISATGTGVLIMIDLANWHSCSFIETQDVGRVYANGTFEVLGRLDLSDIRGCSLLVV
jgi:acyl-CoA synthetase (AMP-forming)/AMP-acid ligase II